MISWHYEPRSRRYGYEPNTQQRGGKRTPLRTFAEFAEEFGVTQRQLGAALHNHNGPAAAVQSSVHGRYYDPALMRAWWASVQTKGTE